MNADFEETAHNHSPVFSTFAYSLLEDILANAAHPARMNLQLVEQLRELTGARLVVLARQRELEGGHELAAVEPQRRRPLAESPAMMALADMTRDLAGPTLWERGEAPPAAEVLLEESLPGPAVAVPLRVGRKQVGALLLFGLPHKHSLDQVIDALGTLSHVVALVFRNAALFEDQEATIAARTRELADSEERLEVTLRSIGDAVIATDVQGRVTFINPVAEELTGWKEAEAQGRLLGEVFPIINEETRQPVENPVARVLRDGVVVGLANHTLLVARDGTERPIADSGAPIRNAQGEITGVVLVFRDQTEERAAQNALRESEERFRSIFDQTSVSIWEEDFSELKHALDDLKARGVTDFRAYFDAHPEFVEQAVGMVKILDVNDETVRMFEAESKEDLLDSLHKTFTPESLTTFRNELLAIARGQSRFEQPAIVQTLRGKPLHILLRLTTLEEHPSLHRVLASMVDITERVQAEEALQQQAAELAAVNTLGRAVTANLELKETTNAALAGMLDAVHSDLALLFLRDGERLILQDVLPSNARPRLGAIPGHRVGECICGLAAQEKKPLFSRDLYPDPRCTWEECKRAGIKSFAALPLISGDEVIGVIGLASDTERDFEWQGRFLETLAGQVSVGLVNAQLYETAQLELAERKKAEEQLSHTMEKLDASEKRLKMIIETEPECVKVLTPNGVLVDMNRAGLDMIEANSLEQMQGQSILPIIAPEYRQAFRAMLDNVIRGKTEMLVFEIIGLKGTRRWLETHSVPLYDAGNKITGLLGVTRDITERKQLEAELVFERDKFDFILQELPVGVSVLDADHKFIYINPISMQLDGYPKDHQNILGEHVIKVHPEQKQPKVEQLLHDFASGEKSIFFREARRGKRTIEISYHALRDSQEEYIGLVRLVSDITERKRAEEALQQSERALKVRNQIADVLLTAPDEEIHGQILQVVLENLESRLGVFGYTNTDNAWNYAQLPGEDSVPPHQTWGDLWDRALAEKKAIYSNTPWPTPQGNVPILRALDVPIIYQGEVIGNFLVANKATDYDERDREMLEAIAGYISPVLQARLQRDKTEQERRQLEAQYYQVQKIESVGQLTAGIAHDFNNMLTPINGFAELIQMRVAPDDPIYQLAAKILHSGQSAVSLIRQLMAFSRMQIIQPIVLNLNDVLAKVDAILRRTIGEDIALKIVPTPNLWPVEVDPTQIEQILVNLAVNARDAMPAGGVFSVKVVNVTLDEDYAAHHLDVKAGEYVCLCVSDTGVGMSREVQEHIFEPFFTTKEQGKGTGLGLSTVYGLIKQSNGHIEVYSEEGRGATFKIYLPRVEEAAAPPLPQPKSALDEVPSGTETILVVEDAPEIRELVHDVLVQQGYVMLVAQDGQEALRVAANHAGSLDLLLTDVIMPGMSGKDLADQLTQTYSGLKVIFMSGYADEVISRHDILAPGVSLLQKPFSLMDLVRKVREALG